MSKAANNNPFSDFFSQNDFAKLFENYQASPFDLKELMETQRKNMQAITEAQQCAMDGLQAVAQRQAEILSQMMEDNSRIAKEMMGEGTPEAKISKNAELFKTVYERTVRNMQELSEIINKSNIEASKVINKRVSATMNEIQSSLEKTQQKKAA